MFEGLFQPMHPLVIFGIALLVFGPTMGIFRKNRSSIRIGSVIWQSR